MSVDYDGVIKMHFVTRNHHTIAQDVYRQGNSRISSAIPTIGSIPYYFLIATGGGYVEGESYDQEITLDPETHAILTTQMPNSIYKCEHRKITSQLNTIKIGKDAVLEYYIDETIPYKNARYRQKTQVDMEKGAKLILTDGLTSGWSPDDQPFQYRDVGLQTKISYDGDLIYNDYLLVNPETDSMDELGYFEGHKSFNSVVIIDENADGQMVQELRDHLATVESSSLFGISLLEQDGLVLRVLGSSAFNNRKLMWEFINYYREEIQHYQPIDLRKSGYKGVV